MAGSNDLVLRASLDSSGVDSGVAQSCNSIKKLSDTAKLASKGLKSMTDVEGFEAFKAKFEGLGAQIQKFNGRLEGGRMSLKQTQKGFANMAQSALDAYRSMSDEEKSSTEGRWLYNYMQDAIQAGGQLKDTIGDANAAIKAMSADTPILAGITDAIGLAANGFAIVQGGAELLGMKTEDLQKMQTKLTAAIAVGNAAMQIKNALMNQTEIKTAMITIKNKALAIAEGVKTAATNADTIASKAAAVAQEIWNKAIMANPIGALITVILAAVTAIIAFSSAEDDATQSTEELEKEQEEAKKKQEEWSQSVADGCAKQIASFIDLCEQWTNLRTEEEKNQWIKDNKKEVENYTGAVDNLRAAWQKLVNNKNKIINALIDIAIAQAYSKQVEEDATKMIKELEKNKEIALNYNVPHTGDYISDADIKKYKLVPGIDYEDKASQVNTGDGKQLYVPSGAGNNRLTNTGANRVLMANIDEADAKKAEANKRTMNKWNNIMTGHVKQAQDWAERAKRESQGTGLDLGGGGNSGGGKSGGNKTTTKTDKKDKPTKTTPEMQAAQNSIEWYDKQISTLNKKLKSTNLPLAEQQKIMATIVDYQNKRNAKQQELNNLEERAKVTEAFGEEVVQEWDKAMGKMPISMKLFDNAYNKEQALKVVQTFKDVFENAKPIDIANSVKIDKDKLKNIKLPTFNTEEWKESLLNAYNEAMQKVQGLQEQYNVGLIDEQTFLRKIASLQSVLDGMGLTVKITPEIKEKAWKTALNNSADVLNNFGQVLSNLGDATEDKAFNSAGIIAQAIANLWLSYSQATAGATKLGPWGWAAFSLAGLAQTIAVISQLKQNASYAYGGIIGNGNSNYNTRHDGLIAAVSDGEMILNKQQQRRLWDSINGNGYSYGGNVTFTISGKNLQGVLDNYNSQMSRIR